MTRMHRPRLPSASFLFLHEMLLKFRAEAARETGNAFLPSMHFHRIFRGKTCEKRAARRIKSGTVLAQQRCKSTRSRPWPASASKRMTQWIAHKSTDKIMC